MKTYTEKMNKFLADGKIQITSNGLLHQDFETTDKAIQITSRRIGGGFTAGITRYYITQTGITEVLTLKDAYKAVLSHLTYKGEI